MKNLENELKASIQGEVFFDAVTRHVYSVDASIFEIEPMGVVIPKTKLDLQRICEIATHFRIPLTVRGAATGITGGCLGHGLILDLSKYLNQMIAIDIEQQCVICEPGVIQDDLNRQLAPFGYRLGPDTSTGNRATLGGMLANNSAGARSLRYGKMVDHVQEVEILLASGEILSFTPVSEKEWMNKYQQTNQEGAIYRALWEIKQQDAEEIRKRFPQIPRRVSGYNLDELLKPMPFNVAKIIAGSEGTLGIATAIKMAIAPKPKATGLLLLFFDDLLEALRHVPELLIYHPLALEMIDHQIIQLGRAAPLMRNRLEWLQGDPQAILILEIEGQDVQEVKEKLESLRSQMEQKKVGNRQILIFDPKQIDHVWDLRKSGLGILLSKRSYSRAIAFLEDISVSPLQLAAFMERFCTYLAAHGKQAGIYGHVGSGCMHVRPYIDLRDPQELALIRQMMLDISSLLLEYGGTLSGEHGDGWIRSWLNPKMFGERIMQAFGKIKKAFDPLNLMNPGKIIPETDQWQDLRTTPGESLQSPKTFLDFKPEGGFELAADLCNGNGLCRKKEKVMCPSFQATHDEFHSTRARAQALRSIIHKRLPLEAFTSKGLHDVMDLCISCKGCKTECPSQVDMAKFKSEFLYHYQEKHGYSLRSRLFGHIGQINAWLAPFASVFNWVNQWPWMKKGMEWMGISAKRSLPPLATERFSTWFARYQQPASLEQSVILLNDTFTEFNHPEIGQAAILLLNALGYRVILPPWSCCGRPALSKGLLPTARKQASHLIQHLGNYAKDNLPIIGLEPSCLLTLRDDYVTLIQAQGEEEKQLKRILSQCLTFDEFLAQLVDQGNFPHLFKSDKRKVKVHGHCYQKALVGMKPTLKVLQALPNLSVEEIPSGCCGMAGSFGYEKEHEAISMQIGELRLFPTVRASEPDDWIIASGMSCRHQIKDGTQRQALHLVQALALYLK
jgi:FAD/FMN-containing dehydrogenase/Fe-S oxidoreductase